MLIIRKSFYASYIEVTIFLVFTIIYQISDILTVTNNHAPILSLETYEMFFTVNFTHLAITFSIVNVTGS